jgi:hypothetical protein
LRERIEERASHRERVGEREKGMVDKDIIAP